MSKSLWGKDDLLITEKLELLKDLASTIPAKISLSQYGKSAHLLRHISALKAEIIEDFLEVKSEAKTAHQQICDSESAFTKPLAEFNEILRGKMSAFLLSFAEKHKDKPVPMVDGITVSRKYDSFEVLEEDLIPREFMTPDKKKIAAFFKKTSGTGDVPGTKCLPIDAFIVSKI